MTTPIKGRRIVFARANEVLLEDFEVSELGRDEVLVETLTSLISPGTEMAFLQALPNTSRSFPQYPGYSNVGEVMSVGEGVESVGVGDHVVSYSRHASHLVRDEGALIGISRAMPVEVACFFALGSIALQGIRKSRVELGDSVAVIGQGLVGQLAAQLARLSGGVPVIALDLLDYRLRIAQELGADHTVNPEKQDAEREINEITGGEGARVVVEATGHPEAVDLALKVAGSYGRVVLLGSTRGVSTVNFYSDVHKKGVTIVGAHASTRPKVDRWLRWWTRSEDDLLTIKLLERGLLRVEELITHKIGFEEAPRVYELLMKRGEVLGVVLQWRQVE